MNTSDDLDVPFLVVTYHQTQDISWMEQLKFSSRIYEDDSEHRLPTINTEFTLLKYIAECYDTLPSNVIIIHPYDQKFWHQGKSLLSIFNDPGFESTYQSSTTPGYWNFNTQELGSINGHIETIKTSNWWSKCMESQFGPMEAYHDFTSRRKSYTQFVVSRDNIRSLPKEFYMNMYQWMQDNVKSDVEWNHPQSTYYFQRYLEWTWELIFTVVKPSDAVGRRLVTGRHISAKYGAGRYIRDVTHIFVDKFVKPTGEIIFPTCDLNALFGDPLVGTPKCLYLKVDGVDFAFAEDHTLKIV